MNFVVFINQLATFIHTKSCIKYLIVSNVETDPATISTLYFSAKCLINEKLCPG